MTPRERVLAAMAHREPDRTPVFERIIKSPHADVLLGRPCAATSFEYRMERLADGAYADLCLAEARDRVDLAELLGFDMIALGSNGLPPATQPRRLPDGGWQIGDCIAKQSESGWVQYVQVDSPLERTDAELAAEMESHLATPHVTAPPNPDEYIVFREALRLIRERGLDLAVYCSAYAMPVCTLPRHQLEWLHTRPGLMRRLYERYTDQVIDRLRTCAELGADILGLGGDLADDQGPFISPAHYREFVLPGVQRQAEAVHSLGRWATNTSDGNLWALLDDFLVATGVDGYGEIDYAAGMDLGALKERYGDRICFIGNLDIRFVLTRGTLRECREHTVECLRKGWGSGGHILMTSNVVHEGVLLENYLACLEAYRDYFGIGG